MKYQKLNLFAIKLWNWTKSHFWLVSSQKLLRQLVDSRVRCSRNQFPSCQLAAGQVPSRELVVLAHLRASALAVRAFDLAPSRTHWFPLSLSRFISLSLSNYLYTFLCLFSLPRSSSPLQIHLIASHRFASHLIWKPRRSTWPDRAQSQLVGLLDCGTGYMSL